MVTCTNFQGQESPCFLIIDQLWQSCKGQDESWKIWRSIDTIFIAMGTHGFCKLATFLTDRFSSSRWWARRKIGRESDIWSSGRWHSGQISRKVGTASFAPSKISWTKLYNSDWRPKGSDTYTWAANCPSTWGVVRIRPWCNAGLSMGVGGDIDGEIGGSFLHISKKEY